MMIFCGTWTGVQTCALPISSNRAHFWEVYDNHTHGIKPDCWRASWNTPETRLLIALAARIAGEPEAGAAPLAPVIMDALAWGQRLDEAMGFSPYEPEDPLI